jgi:hypothetical protein
VYGTARELLRPYERSHRRAVVMVDAAWDGSPGADAIRGHLRLCLASGWTEFAVVVIEPELESWLMNDNPHVSRVFGCPDNFRQILHGAGFWPEDCAKPQQPKEALDYLRRYHRVRAFNAEFGKLAAAMSVGQCQDAAFIELRDHLRTWFPEQP